MLAACCALFSAATAQEAAAEPGMYPIQIDLRKVNQAGITPGAGYVLVRDLKALVQVSASGNTYTLRTPGSVLRFTAGGRSATLNGEPAKLNATPIRLSETVLLPVQALRFLGCGYQPLEPMKNVRAYSVKCADQDVTVNLAVMTFENANARGGALLPTGERINQIRARALRAGR